MSYLEIYNEQLRDLLCPSTPAARIQMMEDKRTGATVKGLKEADIYSPAEVRTFTVYTTSCTHLNRRGGAS